MTSRTLSIGVIGDFDPALDSHPATVEAIEHAAVSLDARASVAWLSTPMLERVDLGQLSAFDGLWCAPGSPYQSLDGALRALRFARETDMALLGTCGGFQHMALELARDLAGIPDAHHAEYDGDAAELLIEPLSCSLAGRTMRVRLDAASRAAAAYGRLDVSERYSCSYGLSSAHQSRLREAGMLVAGTDDGGEVRVIELPDRRFWVATLFVPQLSSSAARPHPLIVAFVQAALGTSADHEVTISA